MSVARARFALPESARARRRRGRGENDVDAREDDGDGASASTRMANVLGRRDLTLCLTRLRTDAVMTGRVVRRVDGRAALVVLSRKTVV